MYPMYPKSSSEKFYSNFCEILPLHLTQSCVENYKYFPLFILITSHHIASQDITTSHHIASLHSKLWHNWADSAGLEQWLRSVRTAGGRSCPIHDPFWLASISTLASEQGGGRWGSTPHHDITTTTANSASKYFYKLSTFLFSPGDNYFQGERDFSLLIIQILNIFLETQKNKHCTL